LKEAAKAGFKRAVVNRRAAADLTKIPGLTVIGAADLREAAAATFPGLENA
jgi:predicted ATP-dependent serine protease